MRKRTKAAVRKIGRGERRNLYFTDPVYDLAQSQAKKVNRSVSNYLATLVIKDSGQNPVPA